MDIETILRGSLLGELNNPMNGYSVFSWLLLGVIAGIIIAQALNLVLRRTQKRVDRARYSWDNFWRSIGMMIIRYFCRDFQENSIIFYFEESKAEKNNDVSSRSSPGFYEVTSYVMNQIEKPGECYKIQGTTLDGTYVAKSIQDYRLFPSCDIMVDMESFVNTNEQVMLMKSKLTIRSRTQTILELNRRIKQIVEDVTMEAHDGSLWAFMASYDAENGHLMRRMRLETHKSWEHLIMNTHQKSILYTYLNRFENKSWYIQQGIPYKATFLLYGPPGTGKTTIIKILAEQYKRHVVLFSLRDVKNSGFAEMFYNYRFKENMGKVIYVFEDIDADTEAVWSREFKKTLKPETENEEDSTEKSKDKKVLREGNDSKLDLATILQALDGVVENTGLMVVATTNHYERLDPAFIRRFHCRLELSYCCRETANMIASKYFGRTFTDREWEDKEETITKLTPNNVIEKALGSQDWNFFLHEL